MKTLIRLIAIVPLLSLGGCYTQLALREPVARDSYEDQYVYEDEYDST